MCWTIVRPFERPPVVSTSTSPSTSSASVDPTAEGSTSRSIVETSPTSVETTGTLHASASFTEFGDPSRSEVKSRASAALTTVGISSWGTPVTLRSSTGASSLPSAAATTRSARG